MNFFNFGKEEDKNFETKPINVKSEIAPLKKVLLHRPGAELLNLTPDTLERLLFDDIPFLHLLVLFQNFYLLLFQS